MLCKSEIKAYVSLVIIDQLLRLAVCKHVMCLVYCCVVHFRDSSTGGAADQRIPYLSDA